MPNPYYEAISKLEDDNVAKDYILGWASGYLGNPKLEEQRVTEGYEVGYEDGRSKSTDNAVNWTT